MLALAFLLLAVVAVINPILATYESRCPICLDPIVEDEEIAKTSDEEWAHVECVEEVEGDA